MTWVSVYLLGDVLFVAGVLAALWKSGVLDRVGIQWTPIGLPIAVGVMLSIRGSGDKKTIEIDRE